MQKNKTVFIVMSKDVMRRNILDTQFWPELKKRNPNIRIILIVEEGKEEFYEKLYP